MYIILGKNGYIAEAMVKELKLQCMSARMNSKF